MTATATPNHDEATMLLSARQALEFICSGSGREPASRYYSPEFVDHVNDTEFHGLAGVQQSVEFYKNALSNMKISVDDQVIQGRRVASRYVVTGKVFGRAARINGITISRFENGLIREDWSVTDTLGLLRQLGLWRSLFLQFKQWRMTEKNA
ncbi:MAG TPA: ester cyclase [Bradyrhizobium sp.]|nr:ester cyclase [Bradyrhizobium sp.]